MSHQPERKEKNCLNCGATVVGRYCHVCGQENIVPKQNFWSLLKHFVYDIFHFDGKFFDTLKKLIFRPGLVPKEYVQGKRMHYLDPIRMYLFTSAVFFLVFFALKGVETNFDSEYGRSMSRQERLDYTSEVYHRLGSDNAKDSILKRQLTFLLDTTYQIKLDSPIHQASNDTSFLIEMGQKKYLMVADKNDAAVNINIGSSWLDKKVYISKKKYEEKYGDQPGAIITGILQSFLHKLPYMLFCLTAVFCTYSETAVCAKKRFLL